MEFSQPVCTITAVSKDLVRRPTRISYDLSLATLSTNWGVFSRLGTIRRKLLDQLRDALVCSYYVRCVSTPEIFGDVSVNHSRTGGKAIDNTQGRASRLSSSGYRSPDYSCPGGRNWAAIQPRSKRMTRPCARVLCSRAVSWQCRLTCGNLDAGRADVARPGFSSIAAMYLCWPALLRRPLAVRSRLGPT